MNILQESFPWGEIIIRLKKYYEKKKVSTNRYNLKFYYTKNRINLMIEKDISVVIPLTIAIGLHQRYSVDIILALATPFLFISCSCGRGKESPV